MAEPVPHRPTTEELLQNARYACDRLTRAREWMEKEKNAKAAIEYCVAHSEALAARAALPPLRLVHSR